MTIDEMAKEILKHRGEKNQILKTMEEMAELQNALLHSMDGRGSVADVKEELADVCLMLKQLQVIFNLTDGRLEERMKGKAERELKRLGIMTPAKFTSGEELREFFLELFNLEERGYYDGWTLPAILNDVFDRLIDEAEK